MKGAVNYFGNVVRRDISRHAHRNTRRTIDQQVRDPCRQHRWLFFFAIVVRYEIDGIFVDIGQQLLRNFVEPAFGITHRRSVIAVDRAEITLSIHQRVAQGEILRHTYQGVIDGLVAMWMVFTHDLADYARALHVGPIPDIISLVHRVQHTSVYRLETITHIRQRPTHNNAHGVIEVALAHLLF